MTNTKLVPLKINADSVQAVLVQALRDGDIAGAAKLMPSLRLSQAAALLEGRARLSGDSSSFQLVTL